MKKSQRLNFLWLIFACALLNCNPTNEQGMQMEVADTDALAKTELLGITYPQINAYIQGNLSRDLTNFFDTWSKNPHAQKFYSTSNWFYESTIQAQIITHLQNFLGRDIDNWLILQEQRYPGLPDNRADIWVVDSSGNKSLVIEVKADFDLNTAQSDYQKILIANPRLFDDGYVIFCATPANVARWQSAIETKPGKNVFARGVVKK